MVNVKNKAELIEFLLKEDPEIVSNYLYNDGDDGDADGDTNACHFTLHFL